MTLPIFPTPPSPPDRDTMDEEQFSQAADDFAGWMADDLPGQLDQFGSDLVTAAASANYSATSATSRAIGTGSKAFVIETGKMFVPGQFVVVADSADPTVNWMWGLVSAYDFSTGDLTVTVALVGGSGTKSSWSIGLSGARGTQGIQGIQGPAPAIASTSATSLLIGLGAKTLTIGTGLPLAVGMEVKVAETAGPATNWMAGTITAYDSGTGALSVTVTGTKGSGTITAWTVSLAGIQGATGAAGAAGLVLIGSPVTVSSPVAAVDFTGGIDSTYDEYELHLQNVIPTTDGQPLHLRTSANAGSSFASASGDYGGIYSNPDSGAASTFTGVGSTSGALTSIPLGGGAGNDTNEMGWSGVVRIIQPALSQYCVVLFHGAYVTSAGTLVNVSGAGIRRAAAIVNAVRFLFNNGNIQSGKFKLYGVQRV